jgi:biotin carboxyl carrier protein
MKLFTKTEHKEFEFNIIQSAGGYHIKGDEDYEREAIIRKIDAARYSLIINNRSYIINYKREKDIYTITLNGKRFDIEVNDEKSKLWKEIVEKSSPGAGSGKLKAQMPGLVVKFLKNIGDNVNQGDGLVILEAMKMENIIKSEVAGIIKSIHVQPGTAVEKGQLLITIEDK